MYFLYFAIAMLLLSMLAVSACCAQLISEDPEIMACLRRYMSVDMKRYKHTARHTPKYVVAQKVRVQAWYKESLVLSAT